MVSTLSTLPMQSELPPIAYSGALTPQHLEQALTLRRKLIPNPDLVLLYTAAGLFVLLKVTALVFNPARWWAALGITLLLALYVVVSRRFSPLLTREAWVSAPNLHGTVSGVVEFAGITTHFPYGESRLAWRYYPCYAASNELVILLAGATSFDIYPRTFFESDEVWQTFLRHVEAHSSPQPPPEWRPRYARLNALWVTFLFIVLFGGLALLFSL